MPRKKKEEIKEEVKETKSTKRTIKAERKDTVLITILKVLGVFTTIFGFYAYILLCLSGTLDNVNDLLVHNFDISYALTEALRSSFIYITIYMAIVLFYELINYLLYLYNSRVLLIFALVIESITLLILNFIEGFNSIQLYVVLIPILTGIINYFILLLQDNN